MMERMRSSLSDKLICIVGRRFGFRLVILGEKERASRDLL